MATLSLTEERLLGSVEPQRSTAEELLPMVLAAGPWLPLPAEAAAVWQARRDCGSTTIGYARAVQDAPAA